MHTFTYQKALLHTLFLLVSKIVKGLQCILKHYPHRVFVQDLPKTQQTHDVVSGSIRPLYDVGDVVYMRLIVVETASGVYWEGMFLLSCQPWKKTSFQV